MVISSSLPRFIYEISLFKNYLSPSPLRYDFVTSLVTMSTRRIFPIKISIEIDKRDVSF